MSTVDPPRAVAAFDSASAMHASVAAALRGQSFPHLGQGNLAAWATRIGGRAPWPVLRGIYARFGAAEGLRPQQLQTVDLAAVAGWLGDQVPARRYPAVLLGSSNGALAHLAGAMQVPWLPGTVLVPVRRTGDPSDVEAAMRFGIDVAAPLLDRNPDIVLHHMHDQVQDELMAAKMAYLRVKWASLPEAYARFLTDRLAPHAPVILVEDTSTWPVVRVGDRHVFQPGAQGGVDPEEYLRRPRTPTTDETAPEAEWGAAPGFGAGIARWCAEHGHPLVTLRYRGPQAPAHAVATVVRAWYRGRGENDQRLLVPSFVLGDPWLTINTASVPFWTFFSVQPALAALQDHLARSEPYREAYVMLFEHGADSLGIAPPQDWERVLADAGVRLDFLRLDRSRFPHDISFLARYGPALDGLSRARLLWSPLAVGDALDGLASAGLTVAR